MIKKLLKHRHVQKIRIFLGLIILSLGISVQVIAQSNFAITVLTGGTSGVYYPLGVVLAKIYGDNLPSAKISVLATKASVENLLMLQKSEGEIAFATADTVSLAWFGSQAAGFPEKLTKLRGIASIYPNYIHIVARADSNIKTIADLKGKRVSVGALESATEVNARTVFAAANITYKDLTKVEYLPFGNSVKMMLNNEIDATIQSAGLGVSSINDLSNSLPIHIISIPTEITAKIKDPAYIASIIPAGTYQNQNYAVPTIAITNIVVTRSDVGTEQVYNFTKLIFENLSELQHAHSAMANIQFQQMIEGMPIPFHPGALKYFREKGWAIPSVQR
ncbi:MAG TPA: TAXI family TRAP transporter solute-binding subunit [Alphaproteobacteria bacterium]|nr:TAXI family TRAP transporter solute-binding subunit [Alphaproteobacteria bacterium]